MSETRWMAIVKSHVHDLRHMFSGEHLSITGFSETHQIVLIACTCGTVFYKLEHNHDPQPHAKANLRRVG